MGTIGENITLYCTLSDEGYSLKWYQTLGALIYQNGVGIDPYFAGRFLVEEIERSYNLVVLNAEKNDAWGYQCHCRSLDTYAEAEIILLGNMKLIST